MIDAVIIAVLFLMILYYLGPHMSNTSENFENPQTIRSQIADAVTNNLTPVKFYKKYGMDLQPWQLNSFMGAHRRGDLTDDKIKRVLETKLPES